MWLERWEKTHLAKHYLNSGETVLFSTAISSPTWSSSDTEIATVNNGTAMAVSSGVTTITATGNGIVERWVVTVL